MPIDKKPGESKDEFISRCMSIEIKGGKPQDQAYSICITKYEELSSTQSVATDLPPASIDFGRVRRVIFSEDFDEEVLKEYKDLGWKINILSKRKVQRKDRKLYNKLRNVSLNEDNLLFGDIKELNKKFNFDILLHDSNDPILNALMLMGTDISKKKVISSKVITNMEEALSSKEMLNDVDLKLATVSVVFTYEEIPGIPTAKSGSRKFCSDLIGNKKAYTIDEINSLPVSHLTKMGLPADVFAFRGGFYNNPDNGITTAFCRHQWVAKVIVG